MSLLLVLLALAAGVGAAYLWLLLNLGAGPPRERVPGQAYRIGASWVYRLPAATNEPAVTLVAVHGFLQSPAYFTGLYPCQADMEVILVGSGDYHSVLTADRVETPSWGTRPDAPLGTIAHDATVLRQGVRHLARGRQLWVHGHSRGGAVAVEAGRQGPSLFRHARFLLEAPVLPDAALFRPLPRGVLAAVPWLLPLWQREPINQYIRPALGRLGDERKRRLMEAMPRNPKRALTVIRNVADIQRWMRCHQPGIMANLPEVIVVTTGRDRILDTERMERSAQAGGDHVHVTRLRAPSHFISLDQPGTVQDVISA